VEAKRTHTCGPPAERFTARARVDRSPPSACLLGANRGDEASALAVEGRERWMAPPSLGDIGDRAEGIER
jgi:hypothetical protein